MSQNKKEEKREGGRRKWEKGGKERIKERFVLYIPYVILPFSLQLVK